MNRQPASLQRHSLVCALAALLVCLLLPSRLLAQSSSLQVTLRDLSGAGIAGIAVILRDEQGQELVRGQSDREGRVSFGELPSVVRVAVEGQPRGGPRLYQLGDDAQGIRLELNQAEAPARLELRVERDGLVLPDPATMLAPEQGGPLVAATAAVPPAAVATPLGLPTVSASPLPAGLVSGDSDQPAQEPPHDDWVAPLTLLLVTAAIALLRLVQKLRRMA